VAEDLFLLGFQLRLLFFVASFDGVVDPVLDSPHFGF